MEYAEISTIISGAIAIISIILSYCLNLKSIKSSKEQLELKLKHDQKMRLIEKKIEAYIDYLRLFFPLFQQKYINKKIELSDSDHPFYIYQEIVQKTIHTLNLLSENKLRKTIQEHVAEVYLRMRKGELKPNDREKKLCNNIIDSMKNEFGINVKNKNRMD